MTNKKRKITPFQIKKIPKKEFNRLMKEYNNLEDMKSLYHFIKYLKNHDLIIVNKEFKKQAVNFSLKAVASVSFAGVIMTQVLPKMNQESKKVDLTPIETSIVEEYIPEPVEINPVITPEVEEVSMPTMNIVFPKASHTNEASDLKNYSKVKDRYGAYIDKVSKEYGVDSRIITAMIAQENPNGTDITRLGTYGPMCVTSIHNGVTYSYGHYVNGEFVKDNVTIDINALKDKDLYQNGEYGNITKGDALCIEYGTIILKDAYSKISKANDNLSPEEVFPLAIAAYNHGYPDVIRCTKNASNLSEASYSIRYTHAKDSKNDDDQYIEDVFNKISKDDLKKAFTFVDNNGNSINFNLQRNDEVASISSELSNNYKRAI